MTEREPSDPAVPASDATVRLPAGVPDDPYATQRVNLAKDLGIDTTQKLPVGAPAASSEATLKLARTRMDEPPIRIQRVDPPAEAEGRTQDRPMAPSAPRPLNWRWPLGLGALVVLGAVVFLLIPRGPSPSHGSIVGASSRPAATAEALPPEVQAYLERAKAGDTHAMRMLGAMYLQGLNVPRDREKGLYWYRQAAEKGSDAARAELSQIEGGR